MILAQIVTVRTTSFTQNHYRNLGYQFSCGDIIHVAVEHLTKGSHSKVDIQCDTCHKIYNLEFRGVNRCILEKYECKSCGTSRSIKEGRRFGFTAEMNRKIGKNHSNNLKDPTYKENYYAKRRETLSLKYGDPTYNNKEKRKNTIARKPQSHRIDEVRKKKRTSKIIHGDENFNNQPKKEETCLKKYGVRHTNHVPEIFNKIQTSSRQLRVHEETDLKYRGSYEKHFLDFCFKNHIAVSNFHGHVKYNSDRRYYPDFHIEHINLIVEVKSNYTYKMCESINSDKREACLELGYEFMFLIEKEYDQLIKRLSL